MMQLEQNEEQHKSLPHSTTCTTAETVSLVVLSTV